MTCIATSLVLDSMPNLRRTKLVASPMNTPDSRAECDLAFGATASVPSQTYAQTQLEGQQLQAHCGERICIICFARTCLNPMMILPSKMYDGKRLVERSLPCLRHIHAILETRNTLCKCKCNTCQQMHSLACCEWHARGKLVYNTPCTCMPRMAMTACRTSCTA